MVEIHLSNNDDNIKFNINFGSEKLNKVTKSLDLIMESGRE